MEAYLTYFSNTYDIPLRRMMRVSAKFTQHQNEEEISASESITNGINISLCANAWHTTVSCTVSRIVF